MNSVSEIFDLLGGPTEVGRIIGKRPEHAGGMKARGSIPVMYWPRIIAEAKARGIPEITSETLTRVHAEAKGARNFVIQNLPPPVSDYAPSSEEAAE